MPLQLIQGVTFNNPLFVYVPTRTNQPGRLGHSQGHIPYQGRRCFRSFVIHVFFSIILAPNLRLGEKRDWQPRSTSGDCSSPTYTKDCSKSVLCCIKSCNKPSIQPSDPTCQAALISTSRISTTTKIHNPSMFENLLSALCKPFRVVHRLLCFPWEFNCHCSTQRNTVCQSLAAVKMTKWKHKTQRDTIRQWQIRQNGNTDNKNRTGNSWDWEGLARLCSWGSTTVQRQYFSIKPVKRINNDTCSPFHWHHRPS